jgi:hypothetical protein
MRTLLLFSLLALFAACNGTDVGNPPRGGLTDFETSACKKFSFEKGIDRLPAWQPDPELYAGLTCVLWDTSGETLRVRLSNHRDGCGLDHGWEPQARIDDTGVELLLDNPSCSIAACGNCIYDLSFDVQVAALQDRSELSLRVLGSECSGERPVHHTLRLPLASQPSGAQCTYTFENFDLLGAMPQGALHTRCGDTALFGSVGCASGVCTEVSAKNRLCLAPCSSDLDCQPADVMTCSEGVCQLRTAPAP